MPELVTPDGQAVPVTPQNGLSAPQKSAEDINREFSRAMASDDPGAIQAPPARPQVPEGEQPKRGRGRPRKNPLPEEKARTEPKPAAGEKTDKDFTGQCTAVTTAGWILTASVPFTSPYAAVIDANQPALIAALNAGCQNSSRMRVNVERLASGGGGVWAVQLAVVGANMSMQALQIMRDPDLRRQANEATQETFREFLQSQGMDVSKPAETEYVPGPA